MTGIASIEDWLNEHVDTAAPLGTQSVRVLDVLRTQPRFASHASTAAVASAANVNVSTVVRAAQALGYSGWPQLRKELRNRYLESLSATEVLIEHEGLISEPASDAIRSDIASLTALTRTIDLPTLKRVAATIHGARRTLVTGTGTFAAPGIQLAHSCLLAGMDVHLERQGGTALAAQVARMHHEDCLVIFNFWRLPRETLACAKAALSRGVKLCVVTDRKSSQLASLATYSLLVPSEGVSAFPSLTPAVSLVHGLVAEILSLGGTTATEQIANAEMVWKQMDLFDSIG